MLQERKNGSGISLLRNKSVWTKPGTVAGCHCPWTASAPPMRCRNSQPLLREKLPRSALAACARHVMQIAIRNAPRKHAVKPRAPEYMNALLQQDLPTTFSFDECPKGGTCQYHTNWRIISMKGVTA